MKLLGSTQTKITKDDLEITKAVLVHCNIVNINYQHDSRFIHLF